MYAELVVWENIKAIAGPMVDAVQGAAHQRQAGNTVECKFCRRRHEKSKQKCHAYSKKCKKYGKENHFAVRCRASPEQRKKKYVHTVAQYESDE